MKKTLIKTPAIKNLPQNFFVFIGRTLIFMLLLILYIIGLGAIKITSGKWIPKVIKEKIVLPMTTFYEKVITAVEIKNSGSISQVDLIELSLKNMETKKTRTWVTIGGMTIGIGAIVFLVSIGYGLQELVINRVARLDEMKQADISPQSGSVLKITDKTLTDFKDIANVEQALPLIAVVGKVNYQSSVSDVVVYGVTSEYLRQSAIKPTLGEIFVSDDLTTKIVASPAAKKSNYVASKIGEIGDKIQDVEYTVDQGTWIRVRENAAAESKILGYTKKVEGSSNGEEFWGEKYSAVNDIGTAGENNDGEIIGKWIKAPVLLWTKKSCQAQDNGDCEDGQYVVLRDEDGKQVQKEGFFAETGITIAGAETETITATETDTGNETTTNEDEWVSLLSSETVAATAEKVTPVTLPATAKKQAVVNRAMLKILGIDENEAIGKKFATSFVVVGDLLADEKEKIESVPVDYTIVGVIPEEKTPVFYVPFIDLRSLGVSNYSQVKLVVNKQDNLPKVRKQVEAMGYVTKSVSDTVEQINALFATAKLVLMLLGMVALAVAALGMFNTLTVSLLERTREVGLMKAMRMKKSEVRELFLTESMIMGFFGGILGIVVGFLAGKLLGLILSFFTVFNGVGFVDIAYIPLSFVLVIIGLSLIVGIGTGIFPARRATKISALDALRYE